MKLVVVGPATLIREGIRRLAETQPDVEIAAETDDQHAALGAVAETRPAVVVVYLSAPDVNGVELIHQLRARWPEIGLVTVSEAGDEAVVRAARIAGARASVGCPSPAPELLRAVEAAAEGRSYIAPELDLPRGEADPVFTHLTPRERQILGRVADGSTSQEIAEALGIRYKTVDAHRQRIMQKLGASRVADLVKHAIRAGLTTVDRLP